MSHPLYWQPDLSLAEVQVLSCEPAPASGYIVTLEQTIFHPQGGGQLSDVGWIAEVEVIHVEKVGDEIHHHVLRPLALGPALARLDIDRRKLHSRLHSAGHLLGNVFEAYGWKPYRGHHWPGEAKVMFSAGAAATLPSAEQVNCDYAALVEQNLPLKVVMDASGFRQVGFGGLGMHGCGGTHVQSTAELGGLVLSGMKSSNGVLTVRYDVA
jgi:alanyl-tRNA synthetase